LVHDKDVESFKDLSYRCKLWIGARRYGKIKIFLAHLFPWGNVVPVYILLSKLTSEGRETIKARPERIKEVDKEIEAFGAKVIEQFAVLGCYDFVNVVEAPNNEAITQVSIELGSRGTVEITSMPAMPIDSFISMIRNASSQEEHKSFMNRM
jgi:uncharacterized protein with GYD domain